GVGVHSTLASMGSPSSLGEEASGRAGGLAGGRASMGSPSSLGEEKMPDRREHVLVEPASMGSPNSLGEEESASADDASRHRASMGSPSSLGEECGSRVWHQGREGGFNGVAEFTRRRVLE